MSRGVCYIACGAAAERELGWSRAALQRLHPELPVALAPARCEGTWTPSQRARLAKVELDVWSPWEQTLYLDADTIPQGSLRAGFDLLDAGWELVLTPHVRQGADGARHLGQRDARAVVDAYPTLSAPGQLWQPSSAVLWFAKTPAVRALFARWRLEWRSAMHKDQGALMRALRTSPVRMFVLGSDFNTPISTPGIRVLHRFGRAHTP